MTTEWLRIEGGVPLAGTMRVSGSKNAALPAMVAALLTTEPVILENVPDIEDVGTMTTLLRHLGVEVERRDGTMSVHAKDLRSARPPDDIAARMRASFLLLGALTARLGEAHLPRPGGDDIGMRRVEQHIEGLRALGATVVEDAAGFRVQVAGRLRGAHVRLDMPTVTGTENLIMAAVLAEGITVLTNAAREPHVCDVAQCLRGMGARITGVGTEEIVIEGVTALHGSRHTVCPDYLEAGTFAFAAAATGGDVVLEDVVCDDLRHPIHKLRQAGCLVDEGARAIRIRRPGRLRAVDTTTWPHPGFPTDLQAPYVALMTQADGTCIVSEVVFENRFRHVAELNRLGAQVRVEGRSAFVTGPSQLRGTRLRIPDIRSGAALVIAGLCATGLTECAGVLHLDRGYADLVGKLRGCGARMERVPGTSDVGSEEPLVLDAGGPGE